MQRQVSYCNMYVILLLAALLLQISPQHAKSGSIVEYLPGFEGPLPFQLETGYVGLGESEDEGQAFYYFVESENNSDKDPLMLWLTGGPGCSSFCGLVYEIGPLAFKADQEYNGSLPTLVLRPESWTKACSIIFVDLPIGTGFSYGNATAPQRSDWKSIHHVNQFLRKWLDDHPKFQSNQVYIGGDSYSGITIPVIIQEISEENENGIKPSINIQGYVIGNPRTTSEEENYIVPFAHGMALISDELYLSLQSTCRGNYIHVDSANKLCARDMNYLHELLSGLNEFSTLDPKCDFASPRPFSRRSMMMELQMSIMAHLGWPTPNCQNYPYVFSYHWADDEEVREALHVRKGTVGNWQRCNSQGYEYEIFSSFEYHVNLSKKGYRSLIYSGDHDPSIPFMATQAWIRQLNYSIADEWRPWFVDEDVAGYTRTYSNQMTFATVKGAGHVAPEYKRDECSAMFNRWISGKPL